MRIGVIGLGKLGHELAKVIATRHVVYGYDPEVTPSDDVLECAGIREMVECSELILVVVQTPHELLYDGTHPLPSTRADFDYSYLTSAVQSIEMVNRMHPTAVVSTVLPGTCERIVSKHLSTYAYSPSFTAMGTVAEDFLSPEFVLCGTTSAHMRYLLMSFYSSFHDAPFIDTDLPTAELIKMAYNVFIGQKVVFANAMMELCYHTGADVDVVMGTLQKATKRIVSPTYMNAGMGDGGPCHPRDAIAMSYLAQRLHLSNDIFTSVMEAREDQARFLSDVVLSASYDAALPIVVLGDSYKPDSPLTDGSCSLLLQRFLSERPFTVYDPISRPGFRFDHAQPQAVFVVATAHPIFSTYTFPSGSIVIDPFGIIDDQPGCTVRRLGRR